MQRATKLAYNMVTKWGMSDKVGLIYYDPKGMKLSDDQQKLVDNEVKELLDVSIFLFLGLNK